MLSNLEIHVDLTQLQEKSKQHDFQLTWNVCKPEELLLLKYPVTLGSEIVLDWNIPTVKMLVYLSGMNHGPQ